MLLRASKLPMMPASCYGKHRVDCTEDKHSRQVPSETSRSYHMIQRDDAYRFLKNVKGSPAYFQRVMYDVLGMIRQLGLPTWFLIFSAADMQWPDVIQTIARQYGTALTEDVKLMSFEDKSRWLRQNSITTARHFQYRLNTFLQMFLKSDAHPLGKLVCSHHPVDKGCTKAGC